MKGTKQRGLLTLLHKQLKGTAEVTFGPCAQTSEVHQLEVTFGNCVQTSVRTLSREELWHLYTMKGTYHS